jgi:hypothetical protein
MLVEFEAKNIKKIVEKEIEVPKVIKLSFSFPDFVNEPFYDVDMQIGEKRLVDVSKIEEANCLRISCELDDGDILYAQITNDEIMQWKDTFDAEERLSNQIG